MKYKKYIDENGNEIYEEIKDELEILENNNDEILYKKIREREKQENQAKINAKAYFEEKDRRNYEIYKENKKIKKFWTIFTVIFLLMFILGMIIAFKGEVKGFIPLIIGVCGISLGQGKIRNKYKYE